MREIKFRGKDIYTKEWYYGSDKPFEGCSRWMHLTEFFQKGGEVAIDPATVGQWTGLKDCKGVDIYEGDIIRTPYNEHYDYAEYVVGWDESKAAFYEVKCLALHHKDDGLKDVSRGGYCVGYLSTSVDAEVIGNIHEVKNDQS